MESSLANVLFKDMSVLGVDNGLQSVQVESGVGEIPWATVRLLDGPASAIERELDRVMGTADLAYRNETPWHFAPQ